MSSKARVITEKVKAKALLRWARIRDRNRCTYAPSPFGDPAPMRTWLKPGFAISREALIPAPVAELYLKHFYDLLGSGWNSARHGAEVPGFLGNRYLGEGPREVNAANRAESGRIGALIPASYERIDWQRDTKSGFQWDLAAWSRDLKFGHQPGIDVKMPWELARMQHLPQLALFSLGESPESARAIRQEFCHQVLDFCASNPPRFGVNWICTMDVAIRVANWLLAYDIFSSVGAEFAPEFQAEFRRAVYQHGRHIFQNPEWHRRLRTNHYLANACGLLFAALYLPACRETEKWRKVATDQFLEELEIQFHEDGSNFEGSVAYHRLSSEMAVYGCALLCAAGEGKKIPDPVRKRLSGMAAFAKATTKPGGGMHQVGDNDSGRFFKLQPAFQRLSVAEAKAKYLNLAAYGSLPDHAHYWDEDILDPKHLSFAIEALAGRLGAPPSADAAVLAALVGDSPLLFPNEPQGCRFVGAEADFRQPLPRNSFTRSFPLPRGKNLSYFSYPEFGLYGFRADGFYLGLRCGKSGQHGFGGHSHNDQLSAEITIEGQDWAIDPGTFVYSASPAKRNEFRSVKAHFAPKVEGMGETGNLAQDLFLLPGHAAGTCLYFGPLGFLGVHYAYGKALYRRVAFLPEKFEISDFYDGENKVLPPSCAETVSRGYGKIEKFQSPLFGGEL